MNALNNLKVATRADPTEKLDALAAILPPTLSRGRFRFPDQLIAALRSPSGPNHNAEPAADISE